MPSTTVLPPADRRVSRCRSLPRSLRLEGITGPACPARPAGRVLDPPPGSIANDGHAVCVTGFAPDPGEPAGGYFVIRNSRVTPDGACAAVLRIHVIRNGATVPCRPPMWTSSLGSGLVCRRVIATR